MSGKLYLGTSTIDATAVIQADSTSGGVLVPRMTTTQRDAISTPATGLMIYNTTTNTFDVYNGSSWGAVGGGGDVSGGGSSTDNAIVRWDGTGGDTTQDSGVTIDDSDNIAGINSLQSANSAGLDILDQADATKIARVDVSNISTATTRTYDVPDASTTLLGHDTSQTITNKTYTAVNETVEAMGNTTGANNLDYSAGALKTLTLTGNATLTPTNAPSGGGTMALQITQDGTGSRLITWAASIRWAGGTAPTLSTGAGDVDLITLITFDGGTTWLGSSALDYS